MNRGKQNFTVVYDLVRLEVLKNILMCRHMGNAKGHSFMGTSQFCPHLIWFLLSAFW